MLTLSEVSVLRGQTRALDRVSFQVPAGEISALVGANGAGKTTTLIALSGLLPLVSGRALFERSEGDLDIAKTAPDRLVAAGLIHCPEGRQIFAKLTIEENLRLGAFLNRDRRAVAKLQGSVYGLFPILGERRRTRAGGLSGGEQMMLAIGRALMAEPKVLLLDEPSLGLAPIVTETIFDTLVALNRERGVTLLIVEQNAMMALEIADRGFVMAGGRIVEKGNAEELLRRESVVTAYLGVGT